MELEPKGLDIPLAKRDWSNVWMPIASIFVAWLFRRPTEPLDIIVTGLLGGVTIWLTLGPGLSALKYHRSRIVQTVTFIGCVIFCVFIMRTVIPWILAAAKGMSTS